MHVRPDGKVGLLVLNQRHDSAGAAEPFKVLCGTARLVVGERTFSPLKSAGPASQGGSWRIDTCFDEKTIKGPDNLVGVRMEFQSDQPLGDTISIELPPIDFGQGPSSALRVTFSRRMVREVDGGHY